MVNEKVASFLSLNVSALSWGIGDHMDLKENRRYIMIVALFMLARMGGVRCEAFSLVHGTLSSSLNNHYRRCYGCKDYSMA
jgi:hypothetical protein